MTNMFSMIIWDVQHGNSIFLNTPNDKKFYFDIGTGSFRNGSFSPLSYLYDNGKINKLDYLVISHPHADHISDIETIVKKKLGPSVLSRPSGIPEDLIRSSNQAQFKNIVDLYLEFDKNFYNAVNFDISPCNPEVNGGIIIDNFCLNKYDFDNINNYSIVSILEYGDQKIIIPGDIETDGWEMLLKGDNFREAIKGTTVFIASHHGRESGFPDKIFNYFTPEVIIISDCEGIETSAVNKYRNYCKGSKIIKDKEKIDRFVLSTRNDGPIVIKIEGDPFYTPMSRNIYI